MNNKIIVGIKRIEIEFWDGYISKTSGVCETNTIYDETATEISMEFYEYDEVLENKFIKKVPIKRVIIEMLCKDLNDGSLCDSISIHKNMKISEYAYSAKNLGTAPETTKITIKSI